MKRSQPMKATLHQVHVETRDGRLIAVGPALLKEAADAFCDAIRQQILLGREREWSNPHVIQNLNL